MNLIKCPNNHYYNADKFDSCPHCQVNDAGISMSDIAGESQADINTKTASDATSIYPLTTGWLVCIEGALRGKSYPLTYGDNKIGSGTNMNIRLKADNSVAIEDHAIITCDEQTKSFYLTGIQAGYTTLLDEMNITKKARLNNGQTITIGGLKFIFVQFIGITFNW